MPDTRSQRGQHPKDARCFAPAALPALRDALADLSLLLGRGYSPKAALALVGDRYALVDRQRKALQRCAASDDAVARRRSHLVSRQSIAGQTIWIDGYNVLLTVEAALSGGLVLLARDGVYRDLAAMNRHYKRVETTRPALEAIGRTLQGAGATARWLLDQPISNSGRLARTILDVADAASFRWEVELVPSPDPVLRDSGEIVATADSAILDRVASWLDLSRWVVEAEVPGAWVVDLAGPGFTVPSETSG
ncbi:MAG TPA: DUF434 domain-containing protein [Thermoanaerobaculia bacterium]|nr:DUF434 domain-containing protein [Thermoanaerobaculia bacterium]